MFFEWHPEKITTSFLGLSKKANSVFVEKGSIENNKAIFSNPKNQPVSLQDLLYSDYNGLVNSKEYYIDYIDQNTFKLRAVNVVGAGNYVLKTIVG